MRKLLFAVAAVSMIVLIVAPSVMAGLAVGDKIQFSDREGYGRGGEFGVVNALAPTTELFRTFCVEETEFLNFGPLFNVVGITNDAVKGSETVSDPISSETKYLFWQFANGSLSNYDYMSSTPEHNLDADALQNAIWSLEGETASINIQTGLWRTEAINAVAAGPGIWDANVKVLNLTWSSDGSLAQDVLVTVPEPATIIIWSLLGAGGWLGMSVSRRRRPVGRQPWSPENRQAIHELLSHNVRG
jgi:hypothetical protein